MAIDKKAYKADKKLYKHKVKTNKDWAKNEKRTNKKVDKTNKKVDKRNAKADAYNAGLSEGDLPMMKMGRMHKIGSISIATGDKPKRSDYKGDDNENIGRGGKGPKAMSKIKRANASVMFMKDGLVNRFQGSTPKIGKNELMKPVIEALKPTMAEMPTPAPVIKQGLVEKIKPIGPAPKAISAKVKKK